MWTPRKMNKNLPIDFFARRTHFIDHMASTWVALPDEIRGKFYIPNVLEGYAMRRGVPLSTIQSLTCRNERPTSCVEIPFSRNPVVTCAYGDMQLAAHYDERPLILMEHGVGLTFNNKDGATNPGYGGGEGLRSLVSLFLAPNDYIAAKTLATFPGASQVIVGTPKLDRWAGNMNGSKHPRPEKPTVCISFHWDGSGVAPEAGNAWEYYRRILPELAKVYNLVGHGHPKIIEKLTFAYKKLGLEVIKDFEKVMDVADVYVNDCSSTMYEFLVTGKPVVVLNAPWFRRYVHHGLRFWDYSEAGPVCENPNNLEDCIEEALEDRIAERRKRAQYVRDLYPYLGTATTVAANALKEFCYD